MKAPSSRFRFTFIKNRFLCTPVVLFCCVHFLFSQTGTVVDNADNKPIQNAIVALKSSGALALTDAEGKFEFVKAAIKNVHHTSYLQNRFSFSGTHLEVSVLGKNTPVTICLYTGNGRKVTEVANSSFQPGKYTFNLSSFVSASNLLILSIKTGNDIATVPIIYSASVISISNSPRFSSVSAASPLVKASSSDTLIVSKYLYSPVQQPLTEGATIKLSKPETPPPPPGMKSIPGGTFIMGANNPQIFEQNEIPAHEVTLSPFFMDSTEVTQADYALLMGISPWTELVIVNPGFKYPGAANNLPAWFLTWDDAVLYCNARSKRDGMDTVYTYSGLKSGVYGSNSVLSDVKIDYTRKGYRLPTEAEWEYAARAKSTAEFYWGDKADSTALKYARFNTESPLPVASLLPNAFGMYDILGNVIEPTNDFYGDYSDASVVDPIGPATGEGGKFIRCLRGGEWTSRVTDIRAARRMGTGLREFNISVGIRVVFPNK